MSPAHVSLLVFINMLWGYNFIAGRVGTLTFGPLLFSTLRFVVVLLVLLPFIRRVPGQMTWILLTGVLLGAFHYSIMFFALYIGENVSSIAIAAQLSVPISTLLAVTLLGETVGWVRTLAIAMSFAGIVVIAYEPLGGEHVLSLGLAVLAAAAMAAAQVVMRRMKGVGVFNLQAWIALISTIALGILTLLIESPDLAELARIPLSAYWSPVYSAVAATIFGHGIFYYLLQRYPVNQVSPFTTLATLFALVFSVVLLHEPVTWRLLLGGVLTLAGVSIIAQRNVRRMPPGTVRIQR